jgi:aspartyl-tRNA(Asn)/glutamyl-tRNA(Gln) amidotransferase subunit C
MDLRELEETAGLAHLNISREELSAALPAFEQMLGFFAVMAGADKDLPAAVPASGAGQLAGARLVQAAHFRGDGDGAVSDGEALVDNAAERDGRFIVIPNVL